jgi:UDP-N-acetylglucosamine 1-carboxyvinyltransferase
MDQIEIIGGNPVSGEIKISGSKNASLPILACSLLTIEPLKLYNVPDLSDVNSMIKLLESLNVESEFNNNVIDLSPKKPNENYASYDLVRKMRASFLVMGPLLARYGNAKVSLPGGCAIGDRPINIHLDGFKKMGVRFIIEDGYVIGHIEGALKGTEVNLPIRSVGATENIMMAATLALGRTTISNAAKEPEVIDLGNFLQSMGAKISGLGTDQISIIGVSKLCGSEYSVMSDRIEAGTFILLVLGCSGSLKLTNLDERVIDNYIEIFKPFKELSFEKISKNKLLITSNTINYRGFDVKTKPYPGFPTDLQAQLSAVMTKAIGSSTIEETIFENRFMHVAELNRMGAKMDVEGSVVKIEGQKQIFGAPVMATDLRASSCLIIAGFMAEGKTIINRVYHLDRGYENIEDKLSNCNLKIKRIRN